MPPNVTQFNLYPSSRSTVITGSASHGLPTLSITVTVEPQPAEAFTSLPRARDIVRATGRVIVNPTSLTEYPYGGTDIGLSRGMVLRFPNQGAPVFSEGLGGVTDYLEPDDYAILSFFVRGRSDEAARLFFSDNQSAGSVSGHRKLTWPQSSVAGASALSRAVSILFVPDDIHHVPALLCYNAIPDLDSGAEIMFQREEEYGLPVAFHLLRSSAGKVFELGMLSDLSLI